MIYNTAINNDYALRAVALEANFVANAVQSVIDFFPSMTSSIEKGFNRLIGVKQFVDTGRNGEFNLDSKEKNIRDKLTEFPYSDLMKLRLPAPEGFLGNYPSYFESLLESFHYHRKVCLPALEDYYELVANVVTNKNARVSLKDNDRKYKDLTQNRTQLNLSIAKFYISSSSQNEVEYRKLFANNDEVIKTFKLRHQLMAELKNTNVQEVKELVNQINDALNTLIEIAKNGDMEQLSTAQLKNLTAGAYEIASQVEFFAVNYYRSEVAINTFSFAQDKLLARMK